jgi:hypothetical protein
MEMDSQTVMKRSRTGITSSIPKKDAPSGEPRRAPKKRDTGDEVGYSMRLKQASWLALHEAALTERTNVTELILTWLDEWRQKHGLPPVKE